MSVDWSYFWLTVALVFLWLAVKLRHIINWWFFWRPLCWLGIHSREPAVFLPPDATVTQANWRSGCKCCLTTLNRYPSPYQLRKRRLGPYREQ